MICQRKILLFTHVSSKRKNSSVYLCVVTFRLFSNSWRSVGYVANFLGQDTEILNYYKVIDYIQFYYEFTPPPLCCSYIFNFLSLLLFLYSCLFQKTRFLFIFHQNDWCIFLWLYSTRRFNMDFLEESEGLYPFFSLWEYWISEELCNKRRQDFVKKVMIHKGWVFLDRLLDRHSPINPSPGMFTPLNH